MSLLRFNRAVVTICHSADPITSWEYTAVENGKYRQADHETANHKTRS